METWRKTRHYRTDTVDLSPEDHPVKFNGVTYPATAVSIAWTRWDGTGWSEYPGVGITVQYSTVLLRPVDLDEPPPWLDALVETSRPRETS